MEKIQRAIKQIIEYIKLHKEDLFYEKNKHYENLINSIIKEFKHIKKILEE